MTAAPNTRRRADVEAWLDELGVAWSYVDDLDLATIDTVASLANQARLTPLDGDVVARYSDDYRAGDEFPPLLVRHRPRSTAMLLGGNHRYAAATAAGLTTHPAYVVVAGDDDAEAITFEDNRRHGLRPSTDELIAHAVYLVDRGRTHAAAARIVGVDVGKIGRALAARRALTRARDLKIPTEWTERLTETGLWRVDSIEDAEVFTSTIRLAHIAKLGTEQLYSVVSRVNEAATAAEALTYIDDEAERITNRILVTGKSGNRKGERVDDRSRLMRSIELLDQTDPDTVAANIPNADVAATVIRLAKHAALRLMAIGQAVEARHRTGTT